MIPKKDAIYVIKRSKSHWILFCNKVKHNVFITTTNTSTTAITTTTNTTNITTTTLLLILLHYF